MPAKSHGASNTQLYKCWVWMRKRCRDPADSKNKRYAGRGIKVCDEWDNNFETFKEWAINNGYEKGLTIDRINNDGDYQPDNCRWITRKQQNNNRNDNIRIEYKGEIKTLHEWTDQLNIPYYMTWQRIFRCHWSVNDAFTIKKYKRRLKT